MGSRLFDYIESLHGDEWGDVLDAGTGLNSAGWLTGLAARSLTLVTAAEAHARQVRSHLPPGSAVRLLVGDWADPGFLARKRYDTVVADYLIGAVERFAPAFQEAMIGRLASLTRKRLYIIGVDPYVLQTPTSQAGALIGEIGRFRDACLILAGEPPYREYPAEWVLQALARAGMRVTAARRFPIRYKAGFVNSQIDMALMRLSELGDPHLAAALREHGAALRTRALDHIAAAGCLAHGHDYVIAAENG